MDYSNNKKAELDEDAMNYNPWKRKGRLATQFSYEETDENLQIKRSWQGIGTINNSNELSDEDHRSLLNLQRLSVENRRAPFPDFQFELLDNEADTDGSGCELNLATGTRKRLPSRGDSFEDNWLFQKRDIRPRSTDAIDFSLALSKNYDTNEELTDTEVDDLPRDKTDKSESSDEEEWNKVRRVERPCVQTTSSASGDSESISSDSPAENNESQDNEHDDEIPILEDNRSVTGTPDVGEGKAQTEENCEVNDSEDEECTSDKCDEKGASDSSSPTARRKELEEFHRRLMKNTGVDTMSDDSLKDEVLKHNGEKTSRSRPVNPLLPILLARRTPSSCGTRSCDSDDSSSEEFEKKAALYTQRRRASWCHLEKPQPPKRKNKRRPLQQPSLVEEEPLVSCEEGLVNLERQMLRRDIHHTSFRAKKASPNFVLNPLYMPDGDAAQNHRRSPMDEPVEIQQLHPPRYESGYSSGSLDSGKNQRNYSPVPNFEGAGAGRLNDRLPEGDRRSNPSNESPSDSSFLW